MLHRILTLIVALHFGSAWAQLAPPPSGWSVWYTGGISFSGTVSYPFPSNYPYCVATPGVWYAPMSFYLPYAGGATGTFEIGFGSACTSAPSGYIAGRLPNVIYRVPANEWSLSVLPSRIQMYFWQSSGTIYNQYCYPVGYPTIAASGSTMWRNVSVPQYSSVCQVIPQPGTGAWGESTMGTGSWIYPYQTTCAPYLIGAGTANSPLEFATQPITINGYVRVRTSNPAQFPIIGAEVRVYQNGSCVGSPAITDVNGHYSLPFSGAPGSYTVSASLTFPNQPVPIINYHYPNAQQDPTSNPANDLTQLMAGQNNNVDILFPKPIVLVHGWYSDASSWTSFEALFRADPAAKWQFYQTAHRAYPCMAFSYDADPAHPFTLAAAASTMNNNVSAFRSSLTPAYPPTVPIDIVAHSMGGLVTRSFLHTYAQSGSIDKVFTLGTPHIGVAMIWCANLCPQAAQCGTVGTCQMDPLNILSCFEPMYFLTRGARFILVGSSTNQNPIEPECYGWPLGDFDDGVVSTFSSVTYPSTRLPGVIATRLLPQCHASIPIFGCANALNTDLQVMTGTILPDIETL
jgi:pimeloyl-ACP methyl ester carboxylesterase